MHLYFMHMRPIGAIDVNVWSSDSQIKSYFTTLRYGTEKFKIKNLHSKNRRVMRVSRLHINKVRIILLGGLLRCLKDIAGAGVIGVNN